MENRRCLFLILLTVAVLVASSLSVCLAEEGEEVLCLSKDEVLVDGEVVFNDPELQATLESDTDYSSAESATAWLAGLQTLSLTNKDHPVTDLSVLQLCGKLETVVIASDRLNSLEPLTKCAKLSSVTLQECNTVDLEPLTRCKALKSLTILGGTDWDITPVSSMKKLTALSFTDLDGLNLAEACRAPLLASIALDGCTTNYDELPSTKNLKTLSLTGIDLYDTLSLLAATVKTLNSLTIEDSDTDDDLGNAIGACTRLKELTLRNLGDIMGFPQASNKALQTLTVEGAVMDGFSNLVVSASKALVTVSITDCSMGSDVCGSLTACHKLKTLILQNVTGLEFPFEGSRLALASLTVGQADLTGMAPFLRGAVKTLTSITITESTVNDEFCAAVGSCTKLKEMTFRDVAGLSFPEGSVNKTLTVLTLDSCDLTGAAPLIAGAAKALTALTIRDSTADDTVGGAIGGCAKLGELTLQNVMGLRFPDGCANKALATLTVEGSDMEGYSPLFDGASAKLASVSITDCYLGDDTCGSLGACGKLTELNLQNATGLLFTSESANQSLVTLTIGQTNLAGAAPLIRGAAGTLKSLTLSDSSANDTVGGAIGTCGKLEELTILNVVNLPFPDGCENQSLATLTVTGTDMSGFAPLVGGASTSLVTVNITDSTLNSDVCNTLGVCSDLAEFKVQNVAGVDFSLVFHAKSLTTLDLSQLDGSYDLSEMYNLRNLTTLRMSEVRGASFEGVGAMPKLSVLSLYAVDTQDMSFIAKQTKLVEFSVGACRPENFQHILNSMQDKVSWRTASFWGMEINDLQALYGAIQLESLTLGDSNVTDVTPLTEMPWIRTIELYWNPIEDYNPLKELKKAETIVLGSNLDDAIVENLRLALPQAKISEQDAPQDPLYDAGQLFQTGEVARRADRQDGTAQANQWALDAMTD